MQIRKEPCEDAVNRNAVIAVIEDWIEAAKECCHNESASDLSCVKNDIIALPSVIWEDNK